MLQQEPRTKRTIRFAVPPKTGISNCINCHLTPSFHFSSFYIFFLLLVSFSFSILTYLSISLVGWRSKKTGRNYIYSRPARRHVSQLLLQYLQTLLINKKTKSICKVSPINCEVLIPHRGYIHKGFNNTHTKILKQGKYKTEGKKSEREQASHPKRREERGNKGLRRLEMTRKSVLQAEAKTRSDLSVEGG
jgi:hypothetical protein